jgi:amino acid transporter
LSIVAKLEPSTVNDQNAGGRERNRFDAEAESPQPILRLRDGAGLVIGLVIGAGIFSAPPMVAINAGSVAGVLLMWALGGLISLAGAMCYAELATTHPHPGGEYRYLKLAFGETVSFLFAWARLTIIPTGSIALLGFVFGDYASQILSLGAYSSAWYAGLIVALLTALNISGLRRGKRAQNWLTALEVAGLGVIIITGLLLVSTPEPASRAPERTAEASWGLALVFVMLAYGGWNESAYVSAELRAPGRNIPRVLFLSIATVTALYLLVNLAYLHALGLSGMSRSQAIAADVMRLGLGEAGAQLVSVFIAIAALTSANATVLAGARATFAFGRDYEMFSALGRWRGSAPINALVTQAAIALGLVLVGAMTRTGFETMVEYTAPVFWCFFLLTGLSLFVLRGRARNVVSRAQTQKSVPRGQAPDAPRAYRVPLYPLTPALFCCTCAYLLYASVMHTGIGALVGIAMLACGMPVLWLMRRRRRAPGY